MSATTVVGSTLADRYRIERQIGIGGMATVYLARDVKHDRRVALKVLKPDIAAVLGVERFLSEIRVTAQLQHPNLLPLFDSGETGGMLYYVMPYVEGESLRTTLNREKQLPVEHAVHIAAAVALALDYAHAQGVIHRDLKPENILLQAGEPVVADFGIALAVSNAGGPRVTQTGISLGTPQYMSPEQATGDRQIDGRADIYALGAVLHEMLTGEPLHTGATVQAIFARVIADRPQSVQVLRPTVPDHVAFAVERALEKLPADRWAMAREFSEALQGRVVGSVSPVRRAVAPTAPRARFRWALTIAVGAVLSGAAIWGWLLALRRDRPVVSFTIQFESEHLDLSPAPLAVSPDGRSIVYVGTERNTTQLYLRRTDELMARPIPGTQNGARPAFSPDGRWLTFVSQDRLKRIAVTGGAPVELSSAWISHAAWSRKGVLVLGMPRTNILPGQLGIMPATGGDVTTLMRIDSAAGEIWHRWPVVLEDGETILYTSWHKAGARESRIAIASTRSDHSTILDVRGVRAFGVMEEHLIYATDEGTLRAAPMDLGKRRITGPPVPLIEGIIKSEGGAMLAALSRSGTLAYVVGRNLWQLLSVDPTGRTRPLVPEDRSYGTPRLSPDGRRVAVVIGGRDDAKIWVYDIATSTLAQVTSEKRARYPEWSADGTHVFYWADEEQAIRAKRVDGSGPARTILADTQLHPFALHPDGRTLVYTAWADTGDGRLWMRQLDDSAARLVDPVHSGEWAYRFSPDGRWLAYYLFVSGTDQTFVRPFPGPGPRVQVSAGNGREPVWARDGRSLYYRDGQKIVRAALKFGEVPEVVSRTALYDDTFSSWWDVASYDVARDGSVIAVQARKENLQLVVITNWREQLRARLRERR